MSNSEIGFDAIYATDLVYVPDCWKLCGDAHCCNFGRYKSKFKLIARNASHELPLLPGEYEFLKSKGWLDQFGDHDHKVVRFEIDGSALKAESIVSRKIGCVCNHDTRPTVCRLYPLLPTFDDEGFLTGTEPMTIFDEFEVIAGLQPACQITNIPINDLNKFLLITRELARYPNFLFYLRAYSITKRLASAKLSKMHAEDNRSIFSIFETALIRNSIIDADELREMLSALARKFTVLHGERFQLSKDG